MFIRRSNSLLPHARFSGPITRSCSFSRVSPIAPNRILGRYASTVSIPETQRVALIREQAGPIEFVGDYPVPTLRPDEVLAKVLYTGVCQSGT